MLDDGVEKLMARLTASSSGVSVSSREVLDDGVEKLMARLTASSSGVSVMSMDPWHRIAGYLYRGLKPNINAFAKQGRRR